MIGFFKSLREDIRTGAENFVESQSELMKASEKPSCTVRTQRSDENSSRPLLARGRTAISRFYRASVPVGTVWLWLTQQTPEPTPGLFARCLSGGWCWQLSGRPQSETAAADAPAGAAASVTARMTSSTRVCPPTRSAR